MSAFNGDRLKQARLYRGLTIKELSDEIDVSKQAISQYEKSIVSPRADNIMNLVRVLGFPRKFFYEDITNLKLGEVFFRSKLSATKRDQYIMIQTINLISGIVDFIEEYINFPKLDLYTNDDKIIEKMNVEELATEIRNYWGISEEPIKNMVNLLENKGVITAAFDTNKLSIDAFSTTLYNKENQTKRLLIVLGNDKPSAVRRNFNVAHELGHYYFDEGHVELDSLSKDALKAMEHRAHDFAGALLLPKKSFVSDISYDPTSLTTYVNIKKKWNVSISAMVVRAHKLNIITMKEYQNLMRYINRKGWRMSEPFDNEIKRAKPYVLPHGVELLLDDENKLFNKRTFMQALSDSGTSIRPEEVEYLLNLENGTLTEDEVKQNIIKLELKTIL